ncbi:SusC/RagA family TonB-linked outer membrane protein [Chitinophaga parva]|uniref:SusC/RagA family TonB-linked outer membrane protein n=1 Tax=Chitinophaga parva TaxID=2169414 RepID=A0A2T7BNT7_9BACT|nr:SusC/RagA family TonB-linked outer membrane protein [Chitinophaga parva]PUZ29310.1 SusC/RagA family TonB-linked outer membrane protein [Chitinophaga parva]
MKRALLFLGMLMMTVSMAFAQQHAVTGKIVGSDGAAVPLATIQIKGTNTGTAADQEGNFKINVKGNAVLVIRSVGYLPKEVAVTATSDNLQITVTPDNKNLDEVVVTALNIKREKKALGYAIQEVKGDELSKTTEQNVVNTLSGRIAGVQVTASSGAVGASSRIVLRGNNSLSENQPLFVIDGVPVNNASNDVTAMGSVDYGNAMSDIDPNNIESVSVLKGANAAALYGSRGMNGVILITTKSGKRKGKGIGVQYNGGFTFEKPYILPKMQNQYGQGYGGGEYQYQQWLNDGNTGSYQDYAQTQSFSYLDGNGNGVNDGADESWGPRLDAGLKLPQYNSPVTNGVRQATPWISHPNTFNDFFVTGHTLDNSVALTSTTDKNETRLALSNQRQTGTIPNTDQTRYTVNLNSLSHLTDKLTANVIVNYVRTENKNLAGDGYTTNNVMESIGSWFGRQVDVKDLKKNWNTEFENGYPYNWNSNYHDNPYFNVYKNLNPRQRDRIFGNVNMSYSFSNWLNLTGRVGEDISYENRKRNYWNKSNATLQGPGSWSGGSFSQWTLYHNELNADVFLTGNGKLGADFSLSYTAGANYRNYKDQNEEFAANQLTVPNLFTIQNVKGTPVTVMQTYTGRSNSVYGQASLGFKNWLFVDVTGRNDWSSTLPSTNWSYFYPSVSLGWVFTDALKIHSDVFTYGKLRASWAQVGKDGSTYQLEPTFTAETPYKGVVLYHENRTIPNANLKPEQAKSKEAGLELRFLKDRLALDATYYEKRSYNQIVNVDVPGSTGYDKMAINAGNISNKGVEIQLSLGLLRTPGGFNWDMNINWAKNTSKVIDLYKSPTTGQELKALTLTSAWKATVDAVPGQAFGAIRGIGFKRDSATNTILVDPSTGLPQFTPGVKIIGNITPDWVGGISNSFSYKNFNLSFLIDFRKGGDIWSVTDWFSGYTGVLAYTAAGDIRKNGMIVGKDVLQGQKVGYMKDGKLVANDIRVNPEDYFHNTYGGAESAIIDGSYIKFRELTLGYSLPAKVLDRVNWLKAANISLVGRNLWLMYTDKSNKAHIDPETGMGAGNTGLGIEQYQIPSNRSLGVRLGVTF